MLRIQTVILCTVIMVVFSIAAVVADESSEEMCVPLGVIELAAPEEVEAKRSPVEFPHSQHFTLACMECHHMWDGEEQIESCGTSGCHDLLAAPKKDDGDEPILYFKNAYHQSCIGCHKEIKAYNKKLAMNEPGATEKIKPTGPTSCIKCHPKE